MSDIYILEYIGGPQDGLVCEETVSRPAATFTACGHLYVSRPESEDTQIEDGVRKVRLIFKGRGGREEYLKMVKNGEV